MEKNRQLFEETPIPRAVAAMAIPTIVSMLVTMVYNIADTFFIGQTGNALMVSAVSLTSPIFTTFTAFGNLFGIGGSTAISRFMGSGELERTRNFSSFCFYSVVVIGIAMGGGILLGMNPVLKLMGVTESNYLFAKEYLSVIAIGCPFILFAGAFGSIVRSEGAAKAAMTGNMIGTILNIILDPIMIQGMNLGATGAAVATVLGNMGASIYYLIYFKVSKTQLSIRPKDFRLRNTASPVLSIGIPTALNSLLSTTATILMNRVMVQYGTDPVAAMGIAIKVNTMVIFIAMGLCNGVQPLLAYNYGSGNRKRLLGVFRFTAITSVVIGTSLTALLFTVREPVIRIFINNDVIVSYGAKMFGILQMSCPIVGLMFLGTSALQAFGKGLPSLLLSVCRQGLVFIPMLFLFHHLWGLYGAVFAQPVADLVTVILSMTICLGIMRRMNDRKKAVEG